MPGARCPNPVSQEHNRTCVGVGTLVLSRTLVGMKTAVTEAVKRRLAIALVLICCSVPLQCATLERLSLDDMTSKSTLIVRGKITGSYAAFASTAPVIYT